MSNEVVLRSKRFLRREGSTILTFLGSIGIVSTAIMAAKATPKALYLLEEAKEEKGKKLSQWETIKVAGPAYISATVIGVTTLACIFGANVLNKNRQAALLSAYALLDSSYKEYKKKVTDLHGATTDKIVQSEVAKDHYDSTDIQNEDDGKQLFYDEYSHRYFRASNKTILRAEYETNTILVTEGGLSLNDYYDLVGLPAVNYGYYSGWSADEMSDWIYFYHTKVEMEDGMECWIVSYTEPFTEC